MRDKDHTWSTQDGRSGTFGLGGGRQGAGGGRHGGRNPGQIINNGAHMPPGGKGRSKGGGGGAGGSGGGGGGSGVAIVVGSGGGGDGGGSDETAGGGGDGGAEADGEGGGDDIGEPMGEEEIHRILQLREASRKAKDFGTADMYRQQLRNKGIDVFDRDRCAYVRA